MIVELLSLSSGIFAFIFLILIVILLTKRPDDSERPIQKTELKKIKDQINGED